MRFGLLGNLEVRGDDDVPVDLGGVQPRRVLALLLAASGRVVPVDRVIEELWGDEVPASASGTLQSYISRLRRVLEPDRQRGVQAKVLIWEPPGYRLVVDADDVDFRRFERLAREGRSCSAPASRPRPTSGCSPRTPSGAATRWSSSPTRTSPGAWWRGSERIGWPPSRTAWPPTSKLGRPRGDRR